MKLKQRKTRRDSAAAVLSVLSAGLLLVACGSSGGGKAAGSTSGGATTTGKQLVVNSLLDIVGNAVNGVEGVKAAIKEINAAGGVGGRPIQLKSACISNNDPNGAATCARNAANNSDVLAELGAATSYGASVDPIFEHANLPDIIGIMSGPADYTSPVVFSTNAGTQVAAGEVVLAADSLGAKNIGLLTGDNPASHALPAILTAGVLKQRNQSLAASAFIPATGAGDIAPQIASLAKADAQVQLLSGSNVPNAVNTTRRLGYKYPIILTGVAISPSHIKSQIQDTSSLYAAQFYNQSGTGYDAYEKAMAAVGEKGGQYDTAGAISGYLGVHLFADTVKALQASGKNITRQNILAQIRATSNHDTGGLTPPLSWTTKSTVLGGKLPNLINPTVVGYKYSNSEYVPLNNGKFITIYQ